MGTQPRSGPAGRTGIEGSEELPLLLVRAAKAMVAEARSMVDDPDSPFTVVHAMAIRFLDDQDAPTTVALAEHLGVTKQSAGEVVAALEKGGYVERRPHPADGRARALVLTADGRAGLARSRARWAEIADRWAARAGAEDLAALRRALDAYLGA
ncbi:MAG: MarR family winged helix-turn-helix transcriptional regulator [Acidimicrobiales bacterium]